MNRSMWKLAMFDFDGVVFDNFTLSCGAMRAIFKTYGVKPPLRRVYGDEITADWTKFYYGYGIPRAAKPRDLNGIWERYYEENKHRAEMGPGAKELLLLCQERGMAVVIVSASPLGHIVPRLKEFGLSPLVDVIIDNASPTKRPAFKRLIKRFGITTKESFYIGDSASDLIVAKELGITSIGITSGFNSPALIRAAKPDYVIKTLLELIEIMKKGNER